MNTSSRTPVLRSALLKTILSPLLLPLLAALVPQEATALNRYYDPTLGGCTGIYSNPGCWTAGAVPGAGDTPFFNNNGLSYTTQSTASLTHANVYVYSDTVSWDLNGTLLSLSNTLYAGSIGGKIAHLKVMDGTLSSSNGFMGFGTGSDGTVTVENAAWNNSSNIVVGNSGTGKLIINNGGAVASDVGLLGLYGGSSGTATVNSGGSWDTTNALYVGGSNTSSGGTGELNVNAGGSVVVGTELKVWNNGTVNLSGGTITTGSFDSSLGAFNHTGGTLTVDGGSYADSYPNNLQIGGAGNPTLKLINGASADKSTGNAIVGVSGSGTLEIRSDSSLTNIQGFIGYYVGTSGDVLVDGGSSTWTNSSSLYIGGSGTGDLMVSGGGLVTNSSANLGSSAGGSGTATVTGGGSTWTNSGTLDIGSSGTGDLVVSGGGLVTNSFAYLGSSASGSGTATVTGASSIWGNGSNLNIGTSGTGTLTVESEGTVTAGGSVYLGRDVGGTGTATVTGAGSTLSSTGTRVRVGQYGTATLDILDGGVVTSDGYSDLGKYSGSQGTATVSGAGSIWDTAGSLTVGGAGNGTLNIQNGGVVRTTSTSSGDVLIGYDASGVGEVAVIDSNSVLQAANLLLVGRFGTGTLSIGSGGSATAVDNIDIGLFGNSSGTVNLNSGGSLGGDASLYVGGNHTAAGGTGVLNVNAGSTLDVAGTLKVWEDGTGDTQLNISGGTTTVGSFDAAAGNFNFTGGHLIVDGGTYGDGDATLIIDGNNAPTLTLRNSATDDGVANNVYVGYDGRGTLNIQSGSSFSDVSGRVGNSAGSSGAVTVSGAGSVWANSSHLTVGGYGSGTLTVSDQGTVTSGGDIELGYYEAGSGTVTVTGSGSALANSSWNFEVGRYGEGTLNVLAGGVVYSDYFSDLGKYSTAVGTATVSGPGSTWSTVRELVVGAQGTGTLSVRDAGRVSTSTGDIVVGESAGSVGMVTVEGAGTTLHSGGDLVVGRYGTGTLIQEGGNVLATGFADDTYIGQYAGGSGTVTLNGGVMETNGVYLGGSSNSAGGTGVLNVNLGGGLIAGSTMRLYSGGTVNLNGGAIMANALYSDGSFNFNAGTMTIGSDLATSNLGNNFALNRMSTLTVGGTTTLDGFSMFTLDGGTFSTGGLVDNGGFTFNSGTLNITSDNLSIGSAGQLGGDVELVRGQTLTTTMAAVVAGDGLLYLNGGNYSGSLTNAGQVTIDSPLSNLGGTITNDGLLNGNGRVSALLINNTSGEVLAESGDTLRFTGTGNSNSGQITLAGGTTRFEEDLTNELGGVITGRGTLYANGGLTNRGNMGFSAGTTDIHGDVNNEAGASIIVSGGGTLTFFDDLVHNGSEIRVSGGSRAVFFGTVSGTGNYTGTGTAQFEGDLMIGNSPTLTTSTLDMILAGNTTVMELGGVVRGTEYDAFDIDATLEILQGSTLEVVYWESFAANVGDVFDLFIAETILGDFGTLDFSGLGGGLTWQLDHLVDEFGTGDVLRLTAMSAVPLPPAAWLFGSALLGLVGLRRRRSVH